MMPAIDLRQYARNAKRCLDLRNVPEADPLEGQPSPGVYTRRVDGMLPIMLIRIGLTFEELQVKERNAVDQLVLRYNATITSPIPMIMSMSILLRASSDNRRFFIAPHQSAFQAETFMTASSGTPSTVTVFSSLGKSVK